MHIRGAPDCGRADMVPGAPVSTLLVGCRNGVCCAESACLWSTFSTWLVIGAWKEFHLIVMRCHSLGGPRCSPVSPRCSAEGPRCSAEGPRCSLTSHRCTSEGPRYSTEGPTRIPAGPRCSPVSHRYRAKGPQVQPRTTPRRAQVRPPGR